MRHAHAVVLALSLALVACEAKDTTPPPAPRVDPVTSPTPKTKVLLAGSAEYGAVVRVSGGKTSAETTADLFTARWFAEVELTVGAVNQLSVTATDAAGNTSEATVVPLEQAPARPAAITLALSTSTARAGELVGLLPRVVDQYGAEMPDAAVTFGVSPALAPTFTIPGSSPAVTRDQGVLTGTREFVAFDLSAVAAGGGEFTLTATAGTAAASAVLVVRPARATRFSRLGFLPSGTTATATAGVDLEYQYEVVDLYGNVTEGPVSAYTNAPGAVVVEDGVSGRGRLSRLVTAGSYAASFFIAGAGQQGSLTFTVDTAPAAFVDVVAAATLVSPSSPVDVFARVRDAWGNPLACTSATAASITFAAQGARGSAVSGSAVSCFNGAFRSSFTFTTEDVFTVTATWQPTGAAAVVGNVFISVLAFDNTPPAVTLQNVRVNGTPCTPAARTPAGCDVADGDTVEFELVATDTGSGVAEVAYSAFFESTQSLRTRTVFVAPNAPPGPVAFRFSVRTNQPERSDLVGSAVDRAGNRQNSDALTLWTDRGFAVGNRTMTLVAAGGLVDRPQDLAFAANGDLYILSRGGNLSANPNLARLPQGGTTPQLFIDNLPVAGEFLTRAGAGGDERFFVSDRNTRTFASFTAASTGVSAYATLGGTGTSRGLATLAATKARGTIDVQGGVSTGDTVTVTGASSVVYRFDLQAAPTCVSTASTVCVNVPGGGSAAQLASALAAALATSTVVDAQAAGARVMLEARGAGEAGSLVGLAVSGGGLTRSAPTLLEGHDAEPWTANSGDSSVRRYLNTSAGVPFNATTNHGVFAVNTSQWGLGVRDVSSLASPLLQHVALYVVASNGGNWDRLEGLEVQTTATQTTTTSRFAVTQTTGNNTVGFGRLWDVAVGPTGCVLVSDDQGDVYAVDVVAAPFAPVQVTRVARNLNAPRGLAFDAAGALLIADEGSNAVFRLTPDPASACF